MIERVMSVCPLYFIVCTFLVVLFGKWLQFYRASICVEDFMNGLRNTLKQKNYSEAINLCDKTPGPVARVVYCVLVVYQDYKNRDDRVSENQHLTTKIETALQGQINHELNHLESYVNWLPAFGFTSMAFGVLVAVYKLWKSHFELDSRVLKNCLESSFGYVFFGIVLSILCFLVYYYFLSWITRFCREMEFGVKRLHEILQEHPASEEISHTPINTKLRHLGFIPQILPVVCLIVTSILVYCMFQKSLEVRGVTISPIKGERGEDVTMKNVMEKESTPGDAIITVEGKGQYSFRDEKYDGIEKLKEKELISSDTKNIFFILKYEAGAQDIMEMIDLAKHFRKEAFVIVEKTKVQVDNNAIPQEGN